MKLLIYGGHEEEIIDLAKKSGFEIVKKNPEMVASYGGDGTFMKAEKDFPEIPKFAIKRSKICKKCYDIPTEEIFKKIASKEYEIIDEIKLEIASKKGKKIVGLNEIVIHNNEPRRAIRYEIFINDKKGRDEIIGDGVVISTPHGSTGYYRSITDSFFEVGIGVAFNNSTEQSDHMVIKEDSKIRIKIIRGQAIAYADNNPEEIILDDGDEILIKKYKKTAKIIKLM